jgi:hypothetical protein
MTVTVGMAALRVAQGSTAREHGRGQARMIAQAAADSCGVAVGIWLDSLGFIVSRTDDPVRRPDATRVVVVRPRR